MTKDICPGVPDILSYHNLLEMGYEVHEDGPWLPIYDDTNACCSDQPSITSKPKRIWPPQSYRNQWARTGQKKFRSPDGLRFKVVPFIEF